MVGPGRVAEVNGRLSGVEFGKEEAAEMDCSCARDSLDGVGALFP